MLSCTIIFKTKVIPKKLDFKVRSRDWGFPLGRMINVIVTVTLSVLIKKNLIMIINSKYTYSVDISVLISEVFQFFFSTKIWLERNTQVNVWLAIRL